MISLRTLARFAPLLGLAVCAGSVMVIEGGAPWMAQALVALGALPAALAAALLPTGTRQDLCAHLLFAANGLIFASEFFLPPALAALPFTGFGAGLMFLVMTAAAFPRPLQAA